MEEITSTLKKYPGQLGIKGLFRQLGYARRDYQHYRQTLHHMMAAGQVVHLGRRRLALKSKRRTVRGILRLAPGGYGFIDRTEDSIFVSAREARQALDGDTIEVTLVDRGHADGPEGHVVSVDDSTRSPLLAQLRKRSSDWFAEVRSGDYHFTARVSPEHKFQPRSGDWAIIRLQDTRSRYPYPVCQIQEVLGHPDEVGITEKALLLHAGFSAEYPARAVQEARALKAAATPGGLRQDLTSQFVVTIDPSDAKDHDDAVALENDDAGNFLLYVHIADVSRYLPEGSTIAKEAVNRGFSVYLQHHHLPMLPPRLPQELCSLKPGRARLALTARMKIDQQGKVLEKTVFPSQVKIKKLLSYEHAQEILDGKARSKDELAANLNEMWRLAKILQRKRLAEGGIDFDLPDADFIWDGKASPAGIIAESRLNSHRLIEEFMLAANRAVAELWIQKYGTRIPSVYRVHEPPDAEKRQKLSDYLAEAGFEWPADQMTTAAQLKELFSQVERRFPPEVTSIVARKTLMLARYNSKSKGHFGLGFKHYLHFTSPIRRYADLTVHKLIWKHLILGKSDQFNEDLTDRIEGLCDHLNERERIIAEVEREATKLSILQYLQNHSDNIYKAVVVEALRDKIFVALEGYYIEGILSEDCSVQFRSRRNQRNRRLRGKITGQSVAIGDKLKVRVSRIDLLARKLELFPV